MDESPRSGCPINQTVELLGDRWSLVLIRDIVFGDFRRFRELQANSMEKIASNILADRLKRLVQAGILTRAEDPTHKQKAIYSLTEAGIELVPILAHLGAWGRKHLAPTPELAIRAQLMEEGGPALWAEFMDELRERHLGVRRAHPPAKSVLERMTEAYARVKAEQAGTPDRGGIPRERG